MTGKLAATGALAVVAVAVWASQGRIGSGRGSDPAVDVQARPSDATRGQAAAPTETAPDVDSRLAVDWWNRAIEAAGESAAGIRAAALLRGLGEMPEVAKTLGNPPWRSSARGPVPQNSSRRAAGWRRGGAELPERARSEPHPFSARSPGTGS